MQSAGNDFVFIDGRKNRVSITKHLARRLLHRQWGIGADQLLFLGEPTRRGMNRSLRVFNPDGSEAQMCGNGVLCIADYILKNTSANNALILETQAGLIRATRNSRIEVDMGEPILEAARIPVRAKGQVCGEPLHVGGKMFKIFCVSMGNPHCVIFLDALKNFRLEKYGPLIEHHPFFPERTNVEFVEVHRGGRKARVRVWERGAGPTLSCGTGACATLVAGVLSRRLANPCEIKFPGGTLSTRWAGDNHVYLSSRSLGVVFEGQFNLNAMRQEVKNV